MTGKLTNKQNFRMNCMLVTFTFGPLGVVLDGLSTKHQLFSIIFVDPSSPLRPPKTNDSLVLCIYFDKFHIG